MGSRFKRGRWLGCVGLLVGAVAGWWLWNLWVDQRDFRPDPNGARFPTVIGGGNGYVRFQRINRPYKP